MFACIHVCAPYTSLVQQNSEESLRFPQDWDWGWFVSHYMGAGNTQVFPTEPSAQPSSYTAVMTGFLMGQ